MKELEWEERFSELVEFRNRYGNCCVPDKWNKNLKLSIWCSHQRQFMKKGMLEIERKKRLDAIGFIWDINDLEWENMFKELCEFRKSHGHCRVPRGWSLNRKLANWVAYQRRLIKNGKIDHGRYNKLDKLGLQWNIR